MTSTGTQGNDYREIARRPLQADHCALVVVDIQERLLPPIHEKERLVRNAQLLLRLAQNYRLPTIATTQYAKGLGATVPEIASLLPETKVLDKMTFGCFAHEPFAAAVRALPAGRNTLILCGMETHICVLQTALEALNRGYLVQVAADAVSSRTELNWRLGLDRMRDAGAVITSTETIIYELLHECGTPAFKEMLKHLK
jgi:nicotinamidase-related amidase